MVYVLNTPMLELLEDATVEAIRRRAKWKNDDYICRGHILNGMSHHLFDIYHNVESAKELWDSLESKYMAEGALRAEDGSFILIIFEAFILNVELEFKIDLIAFVPEAGSAPPSFSSGGTGVLQTKDSFAES
nr:zinc finger, CCHC-type [Tanacetum cinerariifolium]